MRSPSILFEGKPLTGEPDAGDLLVRFGGRGAANQCGFPTPIKAPKSFPARVGDLLEVELDAPGIVVAELRLHVLKNASAQVAGQLAPGLAGILLGLRTVLAQVRQTAGGGSELTRDLGQRRRLAGLLRLGQRL